MTQRLNYNAASPAGMKALGRSGLLIGFALGGFFDGVLLHQILQWHHLLSLVDGVRDQVLFDGLFHLLMYVLAVAGLALLLRHRAMLAENAAGGRLLAAPLLGFGLWHVTDALLSHWLLGIHRIRVDSSDPLMWDLLWLGLFGLVPIALAYRLGRSAGPGSRSTATVIAILTLGAGGWAARPPATVETMVVFSPGLNQGQALHAILDAGATPLTHTDGIWVIRWQERPRIRRLFTGGALLVGNGPLGAGCLSWTRA